MSLIEKLSNKIGYQIVTVLKLDKNSEEIIAYGAFNLLQILCSILSIMIFATIFNVLIEAFIIFFTIYVLRKYSGGVHASSPGRCIIIGTTVFIGFALIIHKLYWMLNIYITFFFVALSLIVSYYIIYKLAPVDSPAKPIFRVETKKRLKKKSIVALRIFFIIMIIILSFYVNFHNRFLLNIIICICVGILWQSFTLTNKAHKVLTEVDNILKTFCKE